MLILLKSHWLLWRPTSEKVWLVVLRFGLGFGAVAFWTGIVQLLSEEVVELLSASSKSSDLNVLARLNDICSLVASSFVTDGFVGIVCGWSFSVERFGSVLVEAVIREICSVLLEVYKERREYEMYSSVRSNESAALDRISNARTAAYLYVLEHDSSALGAFATTAALLPM